MEWSDKGCNACRAMWERGAPPPELAVSILRHATLHLCPECRTYWEAHERYADIISVEEVERQYGIEALKHD